MTAGAPYSVQIDGVSQRYGRVTALQAIDLAVTSGEFVTFLGPSGCGKTTLLRVIAGFLKPSEGRVLLQGQDVTLVPPHLRPVNTVFQRPSLFPHLDVGENVAFSLRLTRTANAEVDRRVAEALTLVRLAGFERRRSHELSGGQMQRVALARALIGRPRVLLLDEPLSALDLAIRLEMEGELRRVHLETGGTFIYVTHDQREALALSDRVAVFRDGHIEQIGRPEEIYRRPATPFVARFVGDANVLAIDVAAAGTSTPPIAGGSVTLRTPGAADVDGAAWLVLRPEAVSVTEPFASGDGLVGTVRDFAYRGAGYSYRIELPGVPELLKAEVAAASARPFSIGSRVRVSWDTAACSLLPRQGG
jgi:ABC-type Fe3+/spermidine/putrescine transport system ATPase subunit